MHKCRILQIKPRLIQAEATDMNHYIITGTVLVSSGVWLFWFKGFV